jgi:hypothetical protein
MSVTDWVTYVQVYMMGVAIIPGKLTPGLLMTYSMTMMEVWSQIQRRKGVAFVKAFMVSCKRLLSQSLFVLQYNVCSGVRRGSSQSLEATHFF